MLPDDYSDCDPIQKNYQVGRYVNYEHDTVLDPEAYAYPCGLVAKSLFNDTFEISSGKTWDANKKIEIDKTGIAW